MAGRIEQSAFTRGNEAFERPADVAPIASVVYPVIP